MDGRTSRADSGERHGREGAQDCGAIMMGLLRASMLVAVISIVANIAVAVWYDTRR
jgi:hypothetical protein